MSVDLMKTIMQDRFGPPETLQMVDAEKEIGWRVADLWRPLRSGRGAGG